MSEFIVEVVCESDPSHRAQVRVEGVSREYAEQLAGIMDGTSEFYLYTPRDNPTPGSHLAHCQICGGWFRATVKEEIDGSQIS
jgi:hypothetical protein